MFTVLMSPRRAQAVKEAQGDPATALRDHLIDTAERLLSKRQVTSITARDLAREAGVSDGVLYNYFADKSELLLTALLRRFDELLDDFEADLPAPGSGSVEANLRACAEALFRFDVEGFPMFAKLLGDPPLLHRFLVETHRRPAYTARVRRPIVDYFAGERRRGRLAKVDPEAAADLLIGSTAQLALTTVTGDGPPARRLPAIVETLLKGLAQ
jgi:AcrR family transcriptional regulator